MSSVLSIPDDILQAVPNAEWVARVGIAVEGHRAGNLSLGQVARLLGTSVWKASEVLAEQGCHLQMTAGEVREDVMRLREVLEPQS